MSEEQFFGYNCMECDQVDTKDMVQCDLCDRWAHFGCVGVGQEIENEDWCCKRCLATFDGLSLTNTKRVDAAVGIEPEAPPAKSVDTEAKAVRTVAEASSVESIVATEVQDQCSVLMTNDLSVAAKGQALCVGTETEEPPVYLFVKEDRDLPFAHRHLEDEAIFELNKKYLAKFYGSDINETVREIGQQLISDKVLMNYSYMGQRNKKRFKDYDNLTKLVVAATVESIKRRYFEIYGKVKIESDDEKKALHDAAEKYFTSEYIKQAARRAGRSMK